MDKKREILAEYNPEAVVFEAPSYESALIGVTSCGRAVYDYELMLEYLMGPKGMTADEAADFISYNTIRALPYMGEAAPLILYRLEG